MTDPTDTHGTDAEANTPHAAPGTIGWVDLTVGDAEGLRDFYAGVTGWRAQPLDMGGYSDFVMTAASGDPVAGICHARGANAGLPAQWLIYIVVTDLDHSLDVCRGHGGTVVAGPKIMPGQGRYAVIRDPAGAAAALFEPSR